MWKMTLSSLMCIFIATIIRIQVADAAVDCATCTSNYKNPSTDTDCTNLKTYLGCLENAAETKDGCTLSAADAKIIKGATCTSGLDPPCTCQKDFWGTDLTGDKECAALKTYISCLKVDGTKKTCDASTLASALVDKPKGRLDSKCSTTTTPTPAGQKDSGASSLGLYGTIASFLPFVLTAFRL